MKTAIIFGSTGLVGNHLLNLLLNDDDYSKIKIFVRSENHIINPKIEIIKIDFNNLNKYSNFITGDVCFFSIGTTKKETSDNNEYRRVEYDIPVKIAQIAKKNKINSFLYVSSIGSTPKTKNSYLKNKGDVEEVLKNLNFPHLSIIRPSLLLGSRKKFRFGEFFAQKTFKNLSFLFQGFLKQFKPIDAKNVAKAMLVISKNNFENIYFNSDYLQTLSNKN